MIGLGPVFGFVRRGMLLLFVIGLASVCLVCEGGLWLLMIGFGFVAGFVRSVKFFCHKCFFNSCFRVREESYVIVIDGFPDPVHDQVGRVPEKPGGHAKAQ